MSDSSIRTKPSIEDPSNMMSPANAFSNCDAGSSTFLLMPRMSVNCSLRKRTLLAEARSKMSLAEAPDVSGICEGWRDIEAQRSPDSQFLQILHESECVPCVLWPELRI